MLKAKARVVALFTILESYEVLGQIDVSDASVLSQELAEDEEVFRIKA